MNNKVILPIEEFAMKCIPVKICEDQNHKQYLLTYTKRYNKRYIAIVLESGKIVSKVDYNKFMEDEGWNRVFDDGTIISKEMHVIAIGYFKYVFETLGKLVYIR